MIGETLVAMAVLFSVGDCVLDPGKNKYRILEITKDAYLLQSTANPEFMGAVPRSKVETEGKKVDCE